MNKIILIFILAYASSLFGQNTEDFYSKLKKDQLIQIYLPLVKQLRELDSLNAIYVNNKSKIDTSHAENIKLKDSLSRVDRYKEALKLHKSSLEQYIKVQSDYDIRRKIYCANELKTLIIMNQDENISLADFKSELGGKTWKFCPSIEEFNPDWAEEQFGSGYNYDGDIHSIKFINGEMCQVYFRDAAERNKESDWSWSFNVLSEAPKTGYYRLIKLDEENYFIKLDAIYGTYSEPGESIINLKILKNEIKYQHNAVFGRLKK